MLLRFIPFALEIPGVAKSCAAFMLKSVSFLSDKQLSDYKTRIKPVSPCRVSVTQLRQGSFRASRSGACLLLLTVARAIFCPQRHFKDITCTKAREIWTQKKEKGS